MEQSMLLLFFFFFFLLGGLLWFSIFFQDTEIFIK